MEEDLYDDIDTYALVNDILSASSDDEKNAHQNSGSKKGKTPDLERNFEGSSELLQKQYSARVPFYDSESFRRRFHLLRNVFERVLNAVASDDTYFTQKTNCCGKTGIQSRVKVTAALRILAYGLPPGAVDEVLAMLETTARQSLRRFCTSVINTLGGVYLRERNDDDIKHILAESLLKGIPGLLGSIDCCKWDGKNCPTAWHGQFKGKEKKPTVTLEAIADRSLWIWHAFFGMPGCLNDINVVEALPLINKIASGTYPPPCEFRIAGVRRNKPFWFAYGIYPRTPMFMTAIGEPKTKKEALYATVQESIRKDIERAFGVLQAKWKMLARPSSFMNVDTMSDIMKCTIILHNISPEEKHLMEVSYAEGLDSADDVVVGGGVTPMWRGLVRVGGTKVVCATPNSIAALCETRSYMEAEGEHVITKRLLVRHFWEQQGDE